MFILLQFVWKWKIVAEIVTVAVFCILQAYHFVNNNALSPTMGMTNFAWWTVDAIMAPWLDDATIIWKLASVKATIPWMWVLKILMLRKVLLRLKIWYNFVFNFVVVFRRDVQRTALNISRWLPRSFSKWRWESLDHHGCINVSIFKFLLYFWNSFIMSY